MGAYWPAAHPILRIRPFVSDSGNASTAQTQVGRITRKMTDVLLPMILMLPLLLLMLLLLLLRLLLVAAEQFELLSDLQALQVVRVGAQRRVRGLRRGPAARREPRRQLHVDRRAGHQLPQPVGRRHHGLRFSRFALSLSLYLSLSLVVRWQVVARMESAWNWSTTRA